MGAPERIEVRDLFPAERAALLDLLGSLSEEEWFLPTVCTGWSVHDLALHLLAVDVQNLSGGRDRFGGPPGAAPAGDLSDWDTLVAFINGRNVTWVEATRRISPRLLLDLLAFTGRQFDDYLATVDMDGISIPVSWADPEPAPTWFHIAREYTERWIHQQQIRDAVERPGLTEPRFFAPVLDAFARALPHTLRHTPTTPGQTVRLTITGPAGGVWTAVRADDRWRLTADNSTPPTAAVTIDQDLAWRLFTKGIDPATTEHQIAVEGDRSLAAPVLSMVTIMT